MTVGDQMQKAADSGVAKVLVRLVLPVLVSLVGTVLTWLVNDMRQQQKTQQTEMQALSRQVDRVDGKVELMNSKVDNGLIWRIAELERRLQYIESKPRLP